MLLSTNFPFILLGIQDVKKPFSQSTSCQNHSRCVREFRDQMKEKCLPLMCKIIEIEIRNCLIKFLTVFINSIYCLCRCGQGIEWDGTHYIGKAGREYSFHSGSYAESNIEFKRSSKKTVLLEFYFGLGMELKWKKKMNNNLCLNLRDRM